MTTPATLLALHQKYAKIFAPTPTELLAWNILGDRPTEKVVTKAGLFEVDLTAMKADCVAMTAALCNPLDFDSLSDWALGVQWVVDPANKPARDQYNTVFFPKKNWAITLYWDNDSTEKNHLFSYTCDYSTIHVGEPLQGHSCLRTNTVSTTKTCDSKITSCGFIENGRFSGLQLTVDANQIAFTLIPQGVYYADDVATIWTWTQNGPGKESWITSTPTVPTVTEAFTFAIGPTRLYASCDPEPYVPPEEPEEPAEPEDKTAEIINATTYLVTSIAVITVITLVLV